MTTRSAPTTMRQLPAGQPLWGAPRRRQPVAAVIALALVTLLVAAPAAMSSNGLSSNPLVLIHDVGASGYRIGTLLDRSNQQLGQIQQNASYLDQITTGMGQIAVTVTDLNTKTAKLGVALQSTGRSVTSTRGALQSTDTKLGATLGGLGGLKGSLDGSLANTRAVVGDFGTIDSSIGTMSDELDQTITQMSGTVPLTQAFAGNTTRRSITGGDGTKYGIPNILPGNRVMSVVLPMIATMQDGGTMSARKDSATASNALVKTLLTKQVPDGTNIVANVLPFDGTYGLPPSSWFVQYAVDGF